MHVFAGAQKRKHWMIWQKNSNVTPLKLDVTNTEDVKQVKKIIEEKTAVSCGLVNNAGIGKGGPLIGCERQRDVRAQFEVNLFGVRG